MPRHKRSLRLAVAVATVAAALGGAGCGAAASSAEDGRPEPVGYDVAAAWSPQDRTLRGTESIELRNAGPGELPAVWLRLWPNDAIPGEAEGCTNRRARIAGVEGAAIERYAVACSAVQLRLAEPLAPGATATIRMRFAVRVPRVVAQLGRRDGIDLLGRALPILAVRDAGGWHLNPDTAVGDPSYSLSSRWDVSVSVPAGLDVASTGVEVSRARIPGMGRRVVVAHADHARDFAMAIGPMVRRTAIADGVHVRAFATPARAGAAARAVRHAAESVRTYDRWFGPYGAPELDVVVVRLGESSQESPQIVFSDPDRATVVHEVAHQWFYGIVGDDQYREPWLDESFASWSEDQLAPGGYPCDVRRPLRGHRGGLARGLAYYERRPDEYWDVIYRGGSCSLTALERMLGRERFLGLLRDEVSRYRDGVIHTEDFLALLRAADPAVAARWAALVGLPS